MLIHRLHSAIENEGNLFDVEFVVYENANKGSKKPVHSYELENIELKEGLGQESTSSKGGHRLATSINSIDGANLLQKVERTDGNGEGILNASAKTTGGGRARSSLSAGDERPNYKVDGEVRLTSRNYEEQIRSMGVNPAYLLRATEHGYLPYRMVFILQF